MEENKKETKPVEKAEEKKVADKKVEEVKKEEKKPADKKATEVKKEEKKVADKKATEVKKEEKKPADKKVKETKKEAKSKDGKKSNKVAIVGAIIVVVALVVVLAGMFLMPETPTKVVENTLSDLKTGAYAQNMLSGLLQGEDNFNAEAQKLLFEKLDWKVLEEKVEGDKATVEVEITNKDFKTIIGNYMQKALKAAFSGQNINEEEMTNYLMEELRNEEVQTVTNKNTITLEKKDGKWEVAEEDNFVNAVLPGLYEAINSFNQ